jgi:hypothetical protein
MKYKVELSYVCRKPPNHDDQNLKPKALKQELQKKLDRNGCDKRIKLITIKINKENKVKMKIILALLPPLPHLPLNQGLLLDQQH